MDLVQLRYFLAVARHGSINGAARILGISQPSLTQAIRRLERDSGTTLFHRGRNGVTLTAPGRELVGMAEQMLVQAKQVEDRLRGLQHEDIGRFVIGCYESLGAYFLPGFLSSFLVEAPRIDVVLWNGSSRNTWQAVIDREVDFGLIVNPLPHPELVITELFPDAVDVFVAAEPPSRGRRNEDRKADAWRRLAEGPVVYSGRVLQSRQLLEALAAQAELSTRHINCGDLELVKSLALAGIGVALLPRRVAGYGRPGALRRLHPTLPWIPDRICLVYRGDAHRTAAMLRLKNALVAHGRAIAGDGATVA